MQTFYLKKNREFKKAVSRLYISAFPENERPPVSWFFKCVDRYEENQVLVFTDKSEFVGFTYLVIYKDIVYIAYLAVEEHLRNQGYGTQILKEIKELYKNYVLLICFEEVDEKYPDFNLRLRRKLLYERNGFIDNFMLTQEGEVVYQSAYIGIHPVNRNDYKIIFDHTYGPGSSDRYLKFVK